MSAWHYRRFIRPCGCHYQAEKCWGYEVQKWIGGRRSWRFVSIHKTTEGAQKAAEPFLFVLIRCRGCGSEQVREMPPDPTASAIGEGKAGRRAGKEQA